MEGGANATPRKRSLSEQVQSMAFPCRVYRRVYRRVYPMEPPWSGKTSVAANFRNCIVTQSNIPRQTKGRSDAPIFFQIAQREFRRYGHAHLCGTALNLAVPVFAADVVGPSETLEPPVDFHRAPVLRTRLLQSFVFVPYAFETFASFAHQRRFDIAVDITSADESGEEIDMGFNRFRKSTLEIYWQYARKKLGFGLSDAQKANRKLLSDTMAAAGFFPLSFEWWHFEGMPKSEARRRFAIIE